MAEILEQATIAAFIGNPIRPEALLRCIISCEEGSGPYSDCDKFVISLLGLAEDPEAAKNLGILPGLASEWREQCAGFWLLVYVKNGLLVGGHISKRLRTELLPNGYETEPTEQDLQVIQRLLQSVTKPVARTAAG